MNRTMEFVPLKTRIRDWYKNQPKWALVLAFLFLLLFVDKVVRSGPEFKAIAWHRRHGDHITVKGVTFPVHFWYAPKELQDEFSISDEPGPLRPTSSKAPTFFSIKAYKDEKDIGTPKGLVETRIHEFERSGYHGLSKFQMNIRSQTLDCMQEHDARFFGPTIYC